jgi:hypothetical protein
LDVCQRYEPSLATSQKYHGTSFKEDEQESDDVECIGRVLPDGHPNPDEMNYDNEINTNPNTWPINSEEACNARREFVRDGFRRLYATALGQNRVLEMGSAFGVGERVGLQVNVTNQNTPSDEDRPSVPLHVAEEEWMYYAQ